MIKKIYCLFIILWMSLPSNLWAQQIVGLRCNYESEPSSLDDNFPKLSWQILAKEQGCTQTSYRILVSSTYDKLTQDQGTTWDSGIIKSAQSQYIPYGGKSLLSGTTYFWKVCVWDEHGKSLGWSKVSKWQMGLLNAADWQARWITASKWFTPPELRPKGFELSNKGGWADIDLGKSTLIHLVKLYPSDTALFPKRFRILGSDELDFKHHSVLVEQSANDFKLNNQKSLSFDFHPVSARFVRLEVLPTSQNTNLRQLEIFSGTQNVALMKFTREYGTAWNRGHATFLVDGMPSQNDGKICPEDACSTAAAPEFRKYVTINKKLTSATMYYAAQGMLNVTVNGTKVTDEVLGPPFTDYTKRVMYICYDVTNLFKNGSNVIGAVLGNGFFSTPKFGFGQRQNGNGPPSFIMQTLLKFSDGSKEWVKSDDTWKWSTSEITYNDLWDGYTEDRNLAKPGWDQPDYDDKDWKQARLTSQPTGKLVARTGPPNRVNGLIKPIRVDGSHAYFETASVGWPSLNIDGLAGQKITISGGGPGYKMSKITFILAKNGPTVLSPNFIIQPGPVDMVIDGLKKPLEAKDICIQYINADLKESSQFTCSNAYLNELYQVTKRTHRNYINDFPADPNREKQGWTQDIENMFNTATYLTDVRDLYRRWWQDLADNQDERGYLGSVVPVVNRQVYDWNSPWWSGMIVFLPWEHYKYYGDSSILKDAFYPMQRYVDLLGKIAETGDGKNWDDYLYFNKNLDPNAAKEKMIMWNGAGDWNNPFTRGQFAVPAPMTTMPAWYYFASIVSKTAKLLNKNQEAAKYAMIAEDVKNRFNQKYFHASTGIYGDSTNNETAQVLPLAVGLVPRNDIGKVYNQLINAIHQRNDHIGTGFTSTNFLMQMLAEHRESGLANKMVNQQDYPSWKTLIKGGVMLENWSGGGAQMPSCGGSVGAWLFQSVLGIQPDPENPGFRKFVIAPQPDVATGLTSASGYYDSIYGRIGVSWQLAGEKFLIDIDIPGNTMASVVLPGKSADLAKYSPSVKPARTGINVIYYELSPGKYHIETNN